MKLQKSDEIVQNRDFRTKFAILTKLGAETKLIHKKHARDDQTKNTQQDHGFKFKTCTI